MKRFAIASALMVLLIAVAAPAAAFDLNMAASWLDTDNVDSSAGFRLKGDFFFGDSPWAFELGVGYFPELGTSRADFFHDADDNPILTELDLEVMPFDLGINYHFMEDLNFFLGGGLTYALLDTDYGNIENEWGWYLTIGYKTGSPGGSWGFFIEGMYRGIEGVVEDSGDIDEIDFRSFDTYLDGYQINVGATYRF